MSSCFVPAKHHPNLYIKRAVFENLEWAVYLHIKYNNNMRPGSSWIIIVGYAWIHYWICFHMSFTHFCPPPTTTTTTVCSASLSSVDSEESLRAAERLHNRQSRNSAGGISTHSLNEAELAVSLSLCHYKFNQYIIMFAKDIEFGKIFGSTDPMWLSLTPINNIDSFTSLAFQTKYTNTD